MFRSLGFVILLLLPLWAHATAVYQEPQDFISEVFSGNTPEARLLKISAAMHDPINAIMGHDLGKRRLRYWAREGRTAWIVEETGKEQPITVGIVVNKGKIESLKVLIYRESRGFEVHEDFYTDQFKNVGLNGDNELDHGIDGVSGATYSTRALNKLARLALYLDQESGLVNADSE